MYIDIFIYCYSILEMEAKTEKNITNICPSFHLPNFLFSYENLEFVDKHTIYAYYVKHIILQNAIFRYNIRKLHDFSNQSYFSYLIKKLSPVSK